MGLYIPDLRLPADGDFELWIAVRKDGSFTYNVRGGWQDGKQKAIPVPPHGRLISADELIEFIENRYEITWKDDYEGGIKDACIDFLEKISTMPTVIPASEET